jgi:uncharacterized repeat protein (TIGR03809 family)
MAERKAYQRFLVIAQKWRDLAERRRDHFVGLYDSGRWKHYYFSEDEFLEQMREVFAAAEKWSEIAPHPADPFDISGLLLEPLTGAHLEAAE